MNAASGIPAPAQGQLPPVEVVDIEYVAFGHPDLSRVERFYTDFGLAVSSRSDDVLLLRGASERRYCYVAQKSTASGVQAIGMRVATTQDLVRAAQFPEASEIEELDRPGGESPREAAAIDDEAAAARDAGSTRDRTGLDEQEPA